MDRLPWSAFHWRMIIALGITWVLDGVEAGLGSQIGKTLTHSDGGTLHVSELTWAVASALYLVGQVVGALYFGRQADRLGRRRLFILTLAVYLIANGLTALSFEPMFFLATRLVAGLGIGGEYAAIHSAVDELTPAKYRGRVDIAIAGTYWGGVLLASGSALFLIESRYIPTNLGWRISLLLGPAIGMAIWPLRKFIPESPRWQLGHGRVDEAEATVARLENELIAKGFILDAVPPSSAVVIRRKEDVSYLRMVRVLFTQYLRRSLLSMALMITQSFLYNAIFFTYSIILSDFFKVENTELYLFPFAIGNLLGPLVLGRFFDTIGRRRMIALTYCTSALLLALSGYLFSRGMLDAKTQTLLWCVIFFIASSAASSAYLTVSEIFPVEIRAQAIAIFFSIAQLFGALGPLFFGWIISGAVDEKSHEVLSRDPLAIAYAVAAAIMFLGGVVAWWLGVDAEGKSLEDIAPPLAATEVPHGTPESAG
jgi:MFS family permease